MAYRDKRNRLCGFLNIEREQSKGNFIQSYFMLDIESGKLKIFHDSPTVSTICRPGLNEPQHVISNNLTF